MLKQELQARRHMVVTHMADADAEARTSHMAVDRHYTRHKLLAIDRQLRALENGEHILSTLQDRVAFYLIEA